MLTILSTVLVGALLIVGAMVGGVWWRQERIAYQPPVGPLIPPRHGRKVHYVASDGQPLFAYVVEPDGPPAGLLLAFHGNADLAEWQIAWAREIVRRTSWCVWLAEYRGYGGLGGSPTYIGVREDARAAWRAMIRFARESPASDELPFALFGHSLGSGVATELAAELEADASEDARSTQPSRLVLESPFTSARDMARIVSTRPVQLLWRLIARVHYDTRARLDEIDTPLWIAHGARDWLIPVSMGRELFARARSPGRLLVVADAAHNDVAEKGTESYWRWLADALTGQDVHHRLTGSRRHTETSG